MKSENKNMFEALLHDKVFIDSIVKCSSGRNKYLDDLIDKYPDEKRTVLYAEQFIRINYAQQKILNKMEISDMWANIKEQTKPEKRMKNHRFISRFAFKAAVPIILFVASASIFYLLYEKHSSERIADNMTISDTESVIILSDGSIHQLANDNSQIEYNSDGERVFIKNEDSQIKNIDNNTTKVETEPNKIIVPFGKRQQVILSDGTQIKLNSGSKLVFPAEFTDKERVVYLSGEGYFDVAKDKKRPFFVKTDHLDIKVFGTVFNVSAYDDDEIVSAVLVEGRVGVSQKNKLFYNTQINLTPGQGCFYSVNTENSDKNDVDIENYTSWIDGCIRFSEQPIIDILRKVEKFYNISIELDSEELSDILVSGKLILSDGPESALVYLARTLEVKYEITDAGFKLLTQ